MPSGSPQDRVVVDDADDVILDNSNLNQHPIVTVTRSQSGLCNPLSTSHRFVVFMFICFLTFGNYFCYDTPASLQSAIESELELNNEQYGLLYSIYSWPNVILAFFGGYLIDKYLGVGWGAILFALFVALGQLVFSIGAFLNLYSVVLAGRLIFSIGGESLAVAQNIYTVKWFKGKELNTVFGLQLSFSRCGSTLNQLTMMVLYRHLLSPSLPGHKALGLTLFSAALVAFFSLGCGFVLKFFDNKRDRALKLLEVEKIDNSNTEDDRPEAQLIDNEKEKFRPRDILKFPPTFWLLCFLCVTFYAAIFPLVSFGQLFYVNKFGLDPNMANVCNSLLYFISIPAAIMGGMIVDYFGLNVLFMLISVTTTIFGHCLLAFTFLTPLVPVIIIGCSYSLLASSLWPSVAYVVPEKAIGSAYGVMQSIQNFGLAILFILIGLLVDYKGYLVLELVFITLLSVALAISILLYFIDGSYGGFLTMDGRTRKAKLQAQ